MRIKILLFICFNFLYQYLPAQTVSKGQGKFLFEGIVFGYENDPSKKLFKKNKPTILEGILEGVLVNVYIEDKVIEKTVSNSKGEFSLKLNINEIYKIELTKEGYDNNVLFINAKEIPLKKSGDIYRFTGVEFLLNSFKIKNNNIINPPVGMLYYNKNVDYMEFIPSEQRKIKTGFLGKLNAQDNLIELIKRSVLKNKRNNSSRIVLSKRSSKSETLQNEDEVEEIKESNLTVFKLPPNRGIRSITKDNIEDRLEEIRKARADLEKDKLIAETQEDFLLIQHREDLINAAELELNAAMLLIKNQESKIKVQNRFIYLSIGSLIILLGLLTLIIIYYREKLRMNELLKSKNRKIMDSINYAQRIQQSILLGENEIRKFLPDSFIYYRPKDVVSGDFYWFSVVGGKYIMAVVDCTGHGVPGAFMSLIGNSLLNQIVNEKQILDPASILKNLHTGVLKALRQEKEESLSEDGMEMALCVIDPQNKTVEFAGAMNPLYIVQNNTVTVIHANAQSIGGKALRPGMEQDLSFSSQTISVSKNSTVYMFTDGYMDQFGGENNKKFNTVNFKALLLDIQNVTMQEQKNVIHNRIEDWKKSYRQIDDILVAGFKVN